MEPARKRLRLEPVTHSRSDDDDDELNYDPEEISQKRDPSFRLAQSRATAAFRLKNTFESIFEKYERDFSGVGDEIDLRTGEIVVDNGHLQTMRNEKDVGLDTASTWIDGGRAASGTANEAEILPYSRTQRRSEGKGRILRGDGTATEQVTAIVPGVTSNTLASWPPRLGSQITPWGRPDTLDPMWQAPQIHIPRFRSSFASNFLADRYNLPALDSSQSIWGPQAKEVDDVDQRPLRTRSSAPTGRVPARPTIVGLTRAPTSELGDSDDEECIFMGTDNALTSSPLTQLSPRLESPETAKDRYYDVPTTTALGSYQSETGNIMKPVRSSLPSNTPSKRVDSRFGPDSRRDGATGDVPGLEPASPGRISPGVPPYAPKVLRGTKPETLANEIKRSSSKAVVIELSSSRLLNDSHYLDFSNMSDQAHDSPPLSPPLLGGSSQGDQVIPNSQSDPPSPSERGMSELPAPDTPLEEVSRGMANTSPAPSHSRSTLDSTSYQESRPAYELSDEEAGLVSRPKRYRKPSSSSIQASESYPISGPSRTKQLYRLTAPQNVGVPDDDNRKNTSNGPINGLQSRQKRVVKGHTRLNDSSPSLPMQSSKLLPGTHGESPQRLTTHETTIATPQGKSRLNTPKSLQSTGHRSLISLVPESEKTESSNESEDELTTSSSALRTFFGYSSTSQNPQSGSNIKRRIYLDSTPTKSVKSDGRLPKHHHALLDTERPSAPDVSVMRTPGGTIRRCGDGGLKCGKDFCFTCC
ncbi:hypothetical protein jhhlp_004468 [Lomentospora prolificans]|uniref:Centromere protein Scm3 n=1 Tax=Lomentospora prolificans TaxID=41688 RepID=A0A2N3NBM2_9PEZI|nr:hypothetical protein jhhlp_004468 [Lomentospora prolificans]